MGKLNPENFNCYTEQIRDIGLDKITCDLRIGLFNTSKGSTVIAIISCLGLYSNIFIIINFIYHLKTDNQSSTKNTMKKLFIVLQILDCIQSLYWIFSSLIFKISSNPIHGIFKPFKNMFKYIFISCSFGLGISLYSYFAGALGRSPFITCFTNTEEHFIENIIILAFPVLLIFMVIYQIIYDLFKNKLFISDKTVRSLYKKNSLNKILKNINIIKKIR